MAFRCKSHKYVVWTVVMVVCLLMSGVPVLAYDAWQPDSESPAIQDLGSLLDELAAMVEKAKVGKAAHPAFLQDLESMVTRLRTQRNVIAETCGSNGDYVGGYTSISTALGSGEPKEITGPDVRYLGADGDNVGGWSIVTPDGSLDAHLQALVYFPQETRVDSFHLHKTDSEGVKLDRWWDSHDPGAWILGVFRNNEMLNPNREACLGSFHGWVLFDLYVAFQDSAWFDDGTHFVLEMISSAGEFTNLFQGGNIEQGFSRP